MAFVADDMASSGYPKPTFIVQANNTEYFGEIQPTLINYTKATLQLEDTPDDEMHNSTESIQFEDYLLELVTQKSSEEYCSYEEASSNMEQVREQFKNNFWSSKIVSLFDIEEFEIETSYKIPNAVEIGQWLDKNNGESFFAIPSYETITYFKEEYIEVPKKPYGTMGSFAALSALGLFDSKDYKLEKIEKERQVIDGFEYTAESPFRSLKLQFKPKYSALENYCFIIVIVFSRKSLGIFHAKESLLYRSWDNIVNPKCSNWKAKIILLKYLEKINMYVKELIIEMSSYITEDIAKQLNS